MERRRVNRGQTSGSRIIIAPVGGLNGRDGLADMPEQDAYILDNILPGRQTVDTRKGSVTHLTGLPAACETLLTYSGSNSTKMLAASDGEIFDVTAGGAVGAAIHTGLTSSVIDGRMFTTAGGHFLCCYSGADQPFSFDGAAISALVITGVTGSPNTLRGPHVFKGRIYLVQPGQLGFYYLGVGAIQGAASFFPLGEVAGNGGEVVGIASYTQNAGDSPQDYIVFMTSEGEYLVYAGIDPSNAATFELVGRYYASPPIGRKGWFNYKSDLYVLTEEGILAFDVIRQTGGVDREDNALSSKLGTYFSDATQFKGTHGWQAFAYGRGQLLIVNVPISGSIAGAYVQFAMNTNTNAWTRLTGWNAICWTVADRRAYFGTNTGTVVLADEGYLDDDADITAEAGQAYNYFQDERGGAQANKQFHFSEFLMRGEGAPVISAALAIDFGDAELTPVAGLVGSEGSEWDVGDWDTFFWALDPKAQRLMQPTGGLGVTASIRLRIAARGTVVTWYSTRIIYQKLKGLILG